MKTFLKLFGVSLAAGFFFYFLPISQCPDNSNDISCHGCFNNNHYHKQNDSCCSQNYVTKELRCVPVQQCRDKSQAQCYQVAFFYEMHIIAIICFVTAGIIGLLMIAIIIRFIIIQSRANRRIEQVYHNQQIRDPQNIPNENEQIRNPLIVANANDREKQRNVPLENSDDDKNICSICFLVTYKIFEETKKRRCGHIFHKLCIQQWEKRNKTCPNCRALE